MFNKKKCGKCGEKVSENYNYCPYCRSSLKEESDDEDWGILGKNDILEPEGINIPMGLNSLFNSLVKSLNKQMKEFEKEQGEVPASEDNKISKKTGGISISISNSGNKPPEIKVRSFGNMPGYEKSNGQEKPQYEVNLPSSDLRKFSNLPKKEPQTNIRRLSNKVVYEIKLPGVKTVNDISIRQLESSIEIKAVGEKKIFYKVIPINLPIKKYDLSKGILTLELDSSE